MVKIDEALPPAAKNSPTRKIVLRKANTKYQHSRDYAFITHTDYLNHINGGKLNNRESLVGHGFEWINGTVKCTLCNERFRQARSMAKHTNSVFHINLLKRIVGRNHFIKEASTKKTVE